MPASASIPIKEMLSTQEAIFELYRRMSGIMVMITPDGKIHKKEFGAKLVNKKGADTLISLAMANTGIHVHMSNMTEVQMRDMIYGIYNELRIHLKLNWRKYEIEHTNVPMVFGIIWRFVFYSLRRSVNAGERNFLEHLFSHTFHQQTTEIPARMEQRKGLLSGVSGFMKGGKNG